MPSLRTLMSDLSAAEVSVPNRIFYVQNTAANSQNGGCCLLWTVPAGTKKATFEMWGAGADGQGARCCERAGTMPTNGSYATITVDTTAGQQFTICGAGSGCEGCCCGTGVQAFPSYVISAGSTIGCAPGGNGGCSDFTRGSMNTGYICCHALYSSCGLGDVVIAGTGTTAIQSQYCANHNYMFVAGGWGSDRKTSDWCASAPAQGGANRMSSCPSFPGGAGTPGTACSGGYCTGQHGAGGLVKVSYS